MNNSLGKTGIKVSPLCFGSLTMTPFQADLPVHEGAELICYAFNKGINFLDTAEIYDNYKYIREALKVIPREKIVIATKCYAYDKVGAEKSLKKVLNELGTDYIDIMLLHEQESPYTLKGHYEALESFFKYIEKGYIRATGISTHFISCVKAVKKYPEIQVIHPIINKYGIGIQDGTATEMLQELKKIHDLGIGIYSMKALGGGHLQGKALEALEWIKNIDFLDSTAIGMQSKEEIDFNCSFILNNKVDTVIEEKIQKKTRKLIVEDYCIGCGNCEKRCKQNGIKVVNGKATPNKNCILCGYCATVCPEFCIKVV